MTSSSPDRWRGALLGTALGDATGRPFEGRRTVAVDEVAAWLDADAPLVWTDDTAMTIALATSLVATAGEVDPQHLGDTFAATYRAEPWRGYGAGPPAVFAATAGGTSYLDAAAALFGGVGSHGNGAAMRAAPAAVVGGRDLDRVAEVARAQARVTHAHVLGQDGAALLALAVAAVATSSARPADAISDTLPLLHTNQMRAAAQAALDLGAGGGDIARALGTGVAAVEAVPAAVASFLRSPDDPVQVLITAVTLGGDTDTIAAMAGAIAGAAVGADGLPTPLLERLEERTRIAGLAEALARIGA